MQVYTLAEIRNGTGFARGQQFLSLPPDGLTALLSALYSARITLQESHHDDHAFQRDTLRQIEYQILKLGGVLEGADGA